MKRWVLMAALSIVAACAQHNAAPSAEQAQALARASGWFLCENAQSPLALFATAPDAQGAFVLATFDRRDGAIARVQDLTREAPPENARGVISLALNENGEAVGAALLDADAAADPASAWTAPITRVTLGAESYACDWRPRTRFMGLSAESFIRATRDENGTLVLEQYNVADGRRGATADTLVSGGGEEIGESSLTLLFSAGEERRMVYAPRGDAGRLDVWAGSERVSSSPIALRLIGEDPEGGSRPVSPAP